MSLLGWMFRGEHTEQSGGTRIYVVIQLCEVIQEHADGSVTLLILESDGEVPGLQIKGPGEMLVDRLGKSDRGITWTLAERRG